MAKGVAIRFTSYGETVPKVLGLIKFGNELAKHSRIILKPHLDVDPEKTTPWEFTEAVLKTCLEQKTPEAEIFIAEGADGADTMELFERSGYRRLAEQYSVGLIDLNTAEVEEVIDGQFLRFQNIKYPKILFDSFVISMPRLKEDAESEVLGSLSIMIGAFPARFDSGFFSKNKGKIRKWPIKYSIHDILKCKMPEFALIDASEKGFLLAGIPFEMDKQARKLFKKDWRNVAHLKMVDESFSEKPAREDVEAAPTPNPGKQAEEEQ